MKTKLNGISLIECLLSLAIIASISLMAVRYYIVTTRDMRVSEAITQIKRITSASYEWLSIQRQNDFSGSDGGQTITIQQLVEDKLINDTKDTLTPWGGQVQVAPADDDSKYIKITFNNVPQQACHNLAQQLDYINKDKTNTCENKRGNVFVGEF